MASDDWRNLEIWERVKWARSQQFESATAAAQALDMQPGTYRGYERGPDSAKFMHLDYRYARKFGQAFKVRWDWLLEGVGEPWLTPPKQTEDISSVNNLRAWREYRSLTVTELAQKANTTVQTIVDLETGAARLSDKWLRALAAALDTKPGLLLDLNPEEVDPEILETFSAIPKERRAQALEIIRTFKSYKRQQ